MSVGRNDPCPCGSGKKYKKCCLNKKMMIDLQTKQRSELLLEQENLLKEMNLFLKRKIPFKTLSDLKVRFEKEINDKNEDAFLTWLMFYHKFDNDKRGVEWFYDESKSSLADNYQARLEGWISLRPRLLQAVDFVDDYTVYEDKVTRERISVKVEQALPWETVYQLVEDLDGELNFVDKHLSMLPVSSRFLEDYSNDTSYQKIVCSLSKLIDEKNETEVYEHTLVYKIENSLFLFEFLRSQVDFEIVKWTDRHKELTWVGNKRSYHDSECAKSIKLADVYGTIYVTDSDKKLTFKSTSDVLDEIKARFKTLGKKILFKNKTEKLLGVTYGPLSNTMVIMDKDVPHYFALYAQQNYAEKLSEMNDALLIDEYLKRMEYTINRQVLKEYKQIEVSADFNTIRKAYHLNASSFVTGDNRETSIKKAAEEKRELRILEEEIVYLEELGFVPEKIDNYYTADILRFYKESMIGKSLGTKRKYMNSLSMLRGLLEKRNMNDWKDCDRGFWEELILTDYKEVASNFSKTEITNFLSVLRLLLGSLDRVDGKDVHLESIQMIRNLEKDWK